MQQFANPKCTQKPITSNAHAHIHNLAPCKAQLNNNTQYHFQLVNWWKCACACAFEFDEFRPLGLIPIFRVLCSDSNVCERCDSIHIAAIGNEASVITQAKYYHFNFRLNDIINEAQWKWKDKTVPFARSISDLAHRLQTHTSNITQSNNAEIYSSIFLLLFLFLPR